MRTTEQLSDLSDEDLILLVKTKDYPAFITLFNRYRRMSVSYTARMLFDTEITENIVRAAWEDLTKEAARYSTKLQFKIWFMRILRKHVFAQLKKADLGAASRMNKFTPLGAEFKSSDETELNMTLSSFARLEPEYREIVIYRAMENLSYEDISGITGEKLAKIKTRMDFAIEHFRKTLS